MSISKEIFGIDKEDLSDCPMGLRDYGNGFNDALSAIDEFEISEEELAKIIHIYCYGTTDKQDRELSKAIKQNQHRIFVRKK